MTIKLGDFFPKKPLNEPSLDLNNPVWKTLEGGYRKINYDASVPLKKLEQAHLLAESNEIFKEFWNELHHQGDVGLASYYSVPHLVRIAFEKKFIDENTLNLVTVIEIQRHKNNPPVPKALLPDYEEALLKLGELATRSINNDWDLSFASSVLAAMAVAKGQHKLADAIINLNSEDELDEFLEKYG